MLRPDGVDLPLILPTACDTAGYCSNQRRGWGPGKLSDWPWFEHRPVVSYALSRIRYRSASLDPRSGGRSFRLKNPG